MSGFLWHFGNMCENVEGNNSNTSSRGEVLLHYDPLAVKGTLVKNWEKQENNWGAKVESQKSVSRSHEFGELIAGIASKGFFKCLFSGFPPLILHKVGQSWQHGPLLFVRSEVNLLEKKPCQLHAVNWYELRGYKVVVVSMQLGFDINKVPYNCKVHVWKARSTRNPRR